MTYYFTVTAHAATFHLHLSGPFRLERNGRPIHLPTRKTESLLAYLVLHPGAHTREKLAALLWGDSTDQHARQSLRSALNALRNALGKDSLLSIHDAVQLNPDRALWVDAREFKQVETETSFANLKALIPLYQSELLADFYDDWIAAPRESYRALYLETLLRLARGLRAQGEIARALEYAQTIVTTDRANEPAYQELMLCHAARGDRADALRVYDECVERLRQELNVEPSAETKSIYEWIRAQRDVTIPFLRLVTNAAALDALKAW